jgi:DNA-binding NtrC family response regulator
VPGALLIEHSSSAETVFNFGAALTICHRRHWEDFLPEQLQLRGESLIVANAVPASNEAAEFFHWLRGHPLGVPTLAILPGDDSELMRVAAEAVDDFLLFPVCAEEFRQRVARLLGAGLSPVETASASLLGEMSLQRMVGRDPAFLGVITKAAIFAGGDAPVLLTGETGTGKELCARIVHLMSKRRNGPFIPVECGALPEHLFESEVFGHCRGAFTDARTDQKGLVTLAQGGTLFLDEVDGLTAAAQGKILRLLQEKTYRALGSEHFRGSNIRVIAATNANLENLVRNKQFREDLFFRLNVLRIHLPPLRQRPQDIALLARHFVDEISADQVVAKKVLSPASIRKLEAHSWPGNVRELYNAVQRAMLSAPGSQICGAHIDLSPFQTTSETPAQDFRHGKINAIQKFERDYVEVLLEKHAGNITHAAREAGKDRRAFGRLAKKYGVRQAS